MHYNNLATSDSGRDMTNKEVKILIDKLENGQDLTYAEQLRICRDLLKANRWIIEAKQAGFSLPAEAGGE